MPRTSKPTPEQIDLALMVTCPLCGVNPGQRCRQREYQTPVNPPHAARVRQAEEQTDGKI